MLCTSNNPHHYQNLHLLTVSVIVLLREFFIIEVTTGLADVVHRPERLESWRERSSDKVIITVSIALILLGRIVSTRVSGVLRRILLLAYYKNSRIENIP